MRDLPSLEDIRAQIDVTDRAILDLLAQRSALVASIGDAKARSGDSRILRPAREIAQMRHFLEWFRDRRLDMPVSGFSAIWREIIASSVSQQTPLKVMHSADTLTLARERFGNAASYLPVDDAAEAIRKLDEAASRIAVLPLSGTDWWQNLPSGVNVFAGLPYLSRRTRSSLNAVCVGHIALEESGEDVTLMSCPVETVSADGEEGRIIASTETHHLIMVDGFMNADRIGSCVGSFGSLEIMDALLTTGEETNVRP